MVFKIQNQRGSCLKSSWASRGAMMISRSLPIMAVLSGLMLGSCAVLQGSGPESWDVRAGQHDAQSLPYSLVRITPHVIDVLAHNAPRLSTVFSDRGPPKDIRFGVGDLVGVTIFEAASGGLFIPAEAGVRPGNFITLPSQQVDSQGNISVPYAGNIKAKGKTQVEVQQEIVEALKNRAIEPQVVVTLVEQRATLISVLGDVNAPNRFPVNHAGERILDAIAQAGGPKSQGYEEWVLLERNGKRAVTPFGALIWDPSSNIFVRPEDTLFVYREPQTFMAFGASGSQGIINFESWRMSLSEALAKAGGLNDNSADAFNVFLYRGEPIQVARELGLDVSQTPGPVVPVIYLLNLRDPAGWFLAKKFEMRNKDVIYIPNAPTYEANKAMVFFRQVVGTVNDPLVAALNVYAIKAAAAGTATSIVTVGGGIATAPAAVVP
jgi:polysaccharide export outer membrane protein